MRTAARARLAQACSSACPLCAERAAATFAGPAARYGTPLAALHSSTRPRTSPSSPVLYTGSAAHRPASTLANLSSFVSFFRRNPRPTRSQPSKTKSDAGFDAAVASGDSQAVLSAYRREARAVKQGSAADGEERGVTQETLDAALALLAKEARNATTSHAKDGFNELHADYADLWGWTPSPRARQADVALVAATEAPERIRSAVSALTADGIPMTMSEWTLVVRQLAKHGEGQTGLQLMQDAGVQPTTQAFVAILKEMARRSAGPGDIHAVLSEMETYGVEPDQVVETLLLKAFDRVGDSAQVERWIAALEARAQTGTLSLPTWSILLLHVGRARGFDAAQELLGTMRAQGLKPDGAVLANLAIVRFEEGHRSGKSQGKQVPAPISGEEVIRGIYALEDTSGLKADKRAWQVGLRSALGPVVRGQARYDRLSEGLAVYEEAMAAGTRPDAEMVEPLILSLCAEPEREGGYQRARAIYADLQAAEEDEASDKIRSSQSRAAKHSAATTAIHQALLAACLAAESPATRASSAVEYLDEMRRRGITLPGGDVAGRIIGIMRAGADHFEAFKLYSYSRALEPSALDQDAYSRIVIAFAHLSYPSEPGTPPKLFFELLRDMRRAGYQPSAVIYTELISQYIQLLRRRRFKGSLTDAEDRAEHRVAESLRRVHDTLKLDTFVDMDIPLLNALMDAYNQIGAWAECNEVWDELLTRKPFEADLAAYQPSLNIILDACGHAGAQIKARNIWRWAAKSGIPLNRKNHEAWLECLCRLGSTQEAAQLVCTQYKDGADGLPVPDAEMLRLILRFSWRKPQDYQEVPVLVKETFPDLWESVKNEVETRQHKVL